MLLINGVFLIDLDQWEILLIHMRMCCFLALFLLQQVIMRLPLSFTTYIVCVYCVNLFL